MDEPGARLDKYVTEHCPGLSRTQVQKMILDGYITVNDIPAKSGLKLNAGDKLIVLCYCLVDDKELNSLKPKMVNVDERNQIKD